MTNTRQSFHVALLSPPDGRGNTTRTVYDSLGRVTSTIDALGYATTYGYDALGYGTNYGYDALGRQTSVTDPLTNTVTTAYDAVVTRLSASA